ncbi:MAG: alpha/beta fold hydrolase [Gemmatimonas sp.]
MTTSSISPVSRSLVFRSLGIALSLSACTPKADTPAADSSAPAPTTPKTTINGPAGTLHFDDGGTGGTPVLFVHSFGGETSHWRAQLDHLRASRRAIAMDLRAHGQSAAPSNGDYSVKALSTNIAAIADSLGLTRFILVGHSLGGAAALLYAGDHPDRVAGLVLAGAPGKTPQAASKPVLAALESDKYQLTMDEYMKKLLANAKPEVAAMVDSQFHRLSREQSTTIVKETFGHDPTPALVAYNGPMLVVTGATEPPSPTSIQTLKPGTPVETIAGTSHWMQMDKPDEFNSILDRFLGKITP